VCMWGSRRGHCRLSMMSRSGRGAERLGGGARGGGQQGCGVLSEHAQCPGIFVMQGRHVMRCVLQCPGDTTGR
jgi:hypothetical protein